MKKIKLMEKQQHVTDTGTFKNKRQKNLEMNKVR